MQTIHLSLKASNVTNASKGKRKAGNPYAVVNLSTSYKRDSNKKILGKTEVVEKSLNPDWVKTFTIKHDPNGSAYYITIYVLDFDSNDEEMGSATFQLPTILETKGNTKSFNLPNGGSLYVRAEQAIGTGTLVLKMSGENLKKPKGLFRKSDPFYQIVRRDISDKGVDYKTVHRSQPIVDNLSPDWPEERLYLSTLCYGDTNRTLHLSVYDYDKKHGNHELMGGAEFTLASLVQKFKRGETSFEIQKKCKVTGKIILHWAEITYD